MKTCTNCKSSFEPTPKGRTNLCRECKQAYDREYHRKRSPEAKKHKQSLQVIRRREVMQFVYDFFLANPCPCGESRVACLQFDHLDRESKSHTISNMVREGFSILNISEEIKKCRVLCANCHAVHTAEQMGWYNILNLGVAP